MTEFTREVLFTSAFDKRDPSPSKNYGIGAVRIIFALKGPAGVVTWTIGTDWYPSALQKSGELEDMRTNLRNIGGSYTVNPQNWDLGYHAPTPLYEDQDICQQSCDFLDGKPCYYNGSGLNGEYLVEILLTKGSEGIWPELEKEYQEMFSTEPA